MCLYSIHYFLCRCAKITIRVQCPHGSVDVQNRPYCALNRHPHFDDGITRIQELPTYGPGVCSNIHCRWRFGLLPEGDFGEGRPYVEDDTEFDMSEQACETRERLWFALLTVDQQLEWFRLQKYPQICFDTASDYGRMFLHDNQIAEAFRTQHPERIQTAAANDVLWWELNPKNMCQEQLLLVTSRFLPSEITRPGHADGMSPLKPFVGPFRYGEHRCDLTAVCNICGARKDRDGFQANREADLRLFEETLREELLNGEFSP